MTTTPQNPQNIYDNPDFFAGYAKLRENPFSANVMMVDPARDALVLSLNGKRVVDLGCGSGGFCRKAIAEGAASVLGVDISERMLEVAQRESINPDTESRLRYQCTSLDHWNAPPDSADVIVSILALHYLPEVQSTFRVVSHALAPGGVFVFCVEHPIMTAKRDGDRWVRGENNIKLHCALDNYSDETERVSEWFVSGVQKFHRTIATYLNAVIDANLTITRIVEPLPSAEAIAAYPSFTDEIRRPAFLFVRAEKK